MQAPFYKKFYTMLAAIGNGSGENRKCRKN